MVLDAKDGISAVVEARRLVAEVRDAIERGDIKAASAGADCLLMGGVAGTLASLGRMEADLKKIAGVRR